MPLFTCQGVTEYIGEGERCVCVCEKDSMCVCVGFTCQRWTECPVSWSSAESQGDAGTRCQRACLWIQGTAVKLQWQQTCAINGRLMVKADSDMLINHPVVLNKHIVRYGNYVYVDSTRILYILYSLSNQTCASLQCFCVFDNGCLCQHTTLLWCNGITDWFYYSEYGMLASKVWTQWEGGGASVCLKSLWQYSEWSK